MMQPSQGSRTSTSNMSRAGLEGWPMNAEALRAAACHLPGALHSARRQAFAAAWTFREICFISASGEWNKSLRRIGTGRSTGQGRRFCAFDYSCDATGNLVFNLIKCPGNPQKQVP